MTNVPISSKHRSDDVPVTVGRWIFLVNCIVRGTFFVLVITGICLCLTILFDGNNKHVLSWVELSWVELSWVELVELSWVELSPPFMSISRFVEFHYNDVIMNAMASQITSLTIVYSTVYSGADQRKHQSSASLAFVWGIHRWPVRSPHIGSVTRKIFHLMTSSCDMN